MTYQLTGLPAGTGLSLDPSNGQISGVPTNEDEVASPITLAATAFDGAASTTGNITLNVLNAIDNPPVANDDGPYMLDEGGSIASTFNVLDNDTDSDSPTLNAVLVDPPLNSALFELKPDGTFDYTHDGGETTTDSFTYRADDGVSQSAAATVSLAINPVNDAPVVSVTGPDTVNIKVGDAFADAGASATDAEDGDITADIVVGGDIVDTDTAGTYVITYDVTDSNGAPATQVTRTVNVATNNAPVITLTGAAAITLTTGDAYADAGATAMDDEDGDITANIVVGGAVNTAAAGVYTLTYNVMDMDGNAAAEVTRTVTVNDPPPPPPPPRKKKGGGATGLLEFFGLGFAGLLMFRRRRARKLLA
jgi:VCBS repeat-containing protein